MAPRRIPALLTAGVVVATLTIVGPAATPATAASGPAAVLHGKAGTFGTLGGRVPSGQTVGTDAVPTWGFEAGKAAYFTTLAGDGTVLIANEDQQENPISQTADTMEISAYDPGAHTFSNIRVRTSTGLDAITDTAHPAGADIGDLEPMRSGTAIAFTGPFPFNQGAGQNPATDGVWPSFGILTRGSSGWQVAGQWTANQLHDSNPALGDQACPPNANTGLDDCLGMNELKALPRSGDLVVTQYFPNGAAGHHSGQVMVLHVTGPDSAGHFTAAIAASYVYPDVHDPATGQFLTLAVREVQTDPTGTLGDERFAIVFDAFQADGNPATAVLQELSYDQTHGSIRPVSGPILAGDLSAVADANGVKHFKSMGNAHYDFQGDLWVGRSDTGPGGGTVDFTGGKLAVYAKVSGQRKLGSACPFDPTAAMESYTSSASGARTSWGQSCPPDFDIVQPKDLRSAWGLFEDPGSHAMVELFIGGYLLPIQPAGSGMGMTFTVGNAFDAGKSLLPVHAAVSTGSFALGQRRGAVNGSHQLWFPIQQLGGGSPNSPGSLSGYATHQVLDQWLYQIDVSRLLSADSVPLSATSGQAATVQAENSATVATTTRTGSPAATEVVSVAYAAPCGDSSIPGGGFQLQADSGFGVPDGTALAYRVQVPSAGSYTVSYRALTFANAHNGHVQLQTGSTTATTSLDTGFQWATVRGPTVALPAGTVTIRLSAPSGGGGWYLNWMRLTRG